MKPEVFNGKLKELVTQLIIEDQEKPAGVRVYTISADKSKLDDGDGERYRIVIEAIAAYKKEAPV